MTCFLVITTTVDSINIPPQYAERHVRLSCRNACIVAERTATSSEVADAFGLSAESSGGNGMVVRLDYYSGSEKKEIVERFRELLRDE